jgi:hypothetical protein
MAADSVDDLAAAVRDRCLDHRRHLGPRASTANCGRVCSSAVPVAIIVYICMAALLLTPLILRLLHRKEPDPIHVQTEETEGKASA